MISHYKADEEKQHKKGDRAVMLCIADNNWYLHVKSIKSFNTRATPPLHWEFHYVKRGNEKSGS